MTAPTVLITGATGFLGGATLAALLRSRPDCRTLALVRAHNVEEARTRLTHSVRRFDDPAFAPLDTSRVEIVCGDITLPSTLDDPHLDEVTHVVHAAANTSFRSQRAVRRVNIFGALAFAHRMRRASRLKRFLYVGTAFSCGLLPAGTVVREDDYPRDDARHLVE